MPIMISTTNSNRVFSSNDSDPGTTLAPVAVSHHHGTMMMNEYNLTQCIKLCDTRGFDFIDIGTENKEVSELISSKLPINKKIVRRNDKEYATLLSDISNYFKCLCTQDVRVHMTLIVISLNECTVEVFNQIKGSIQQI